MSRKRKAPEPPEGSVLVDDHFECVKCRRIFALGAKKTNILSHTRTCDSVAAAPQEPEDAAAADLDMAGPEPMALEEVAPAPPPYNVKRRIFSWFHAAKISRNNINDFFKMMQEPGALEQFPEFILNNSAETMEAYKKSLLEEDKNKWLTEKITITPDEFPALGDVTYSAKLRYRDPVKILADLLAHPEIRSSIVLQRKYKPAFNAAGERVYNEPWNCDGMIKGAQEAKVAVKAMFGANSKEYEAMVMAAVQEGSDKALLTKKGRSVYPLHFTLLNIPYYFKNRNLALLALLPVLKVACLSKEQIRDLKLILLRKCLLKINSFLNPEKELGIWFNLNRDRPDLDPDWRYVVPYLLSYVADDPERRDIVAWGGHGSAFPCMACDVARADLGTLVRGNPRSAAELEVHLAHILEMKGDGASVETVKAECEARRASLQAVPSGLQAFGGNRALGGGGDYLNALTGYEAMHTEDLGVLLWIIKALPNILAAYAASPDYHGFKRRDINKILTEINLRMRCLPRTEGQRLPSNTNNAYWCDTSGQIPAAEHRCVMMIAPFLFVGLPRLPKEVAKMLIDLFASYARVYCLRHRKNVHPDITDASLRDLDRALKVFWRHLDVLVDPPPTIKLHNVLHHGGAELQRRLGHVKNLDSQHIEGAHRELIQGYKLTNKQAETYEDQMTRRLCIDDELGPVLQAASRQNKTAYIAAASTGQHAMPAIDKKRKLLVEGLRPDSNLDLRAQAAVEAMAVLGRLPDLLDAEVARLEALGGGATLELGDYIFPRNIAVLAAELDYLPDYKRLQTVHAAESYYGAPWYDFVQYVDTAEETVRTGRLRAIFSVKIGGEDLDYVLVQRYKLVSGGNAALRRWEGVERYRQRERWVLVPLQEVKRRVHMVPDFENSHCVYSNPFQFDALPSDRSAAEGAVAAGAGGA